MGEDKRYISQMTNLYQRLSIFLNSFNRDYLTGQALNQFQEMEQARQLMETSEEAVVIHYN